MRSFFGLELRENQLPQVAEQLLEFLEDELKVKVTLVVSTGEERSATMQRHAL